MKKIVLILATVLIGCSQSNDLPEPLILSEVVSSTSFSFEGNWNCYDWVVDEITGEIHRREIIFSNQNGNNIYFSLNDYQNNGSVNQIITISSCDIDSSFFNEDFNPIQKKYKGVMTTDSTLMVYQYLVSQNIIDTVQVKEFKKD